MKESYGGTWLFQIVIVFLLLFTGIMCLTINQSKSFAVKSELVNYIENQNGIKIDQDTLDDNISEILSNLGYYTTGSCNEGYKGFSREGRAVSTNPAICLKTPCSGQIISTYFLLPQYSTNE